MNIIAIKQAVSLLGGLLPTAEALGVTRGAVGQWCLGKSRPTRENLAKLEKSINSKVLVDQMDPSVKWLRDEEATVIGYAVYF